MLMQYTEEQKEKKEALEQRIRGTRGRIQEMRHQQDTAALEKAEAAIEYAVRPISLDSQLLLPSTKIEIGVSRSAA